MIRFVRRLSRGEAYPRGYGLSYIEFNKDLAVCLPIPFNFIVGQTRKIYFWIVRGPKLSSYDTGYFSGYSRGFRAGEKEATKNMTVALTKLMEESLMSKEPSNLPPGLSEGPTWREIVDYVCPSCSCRWSAKMYFELGAWSFEDDDKAFCPACGDEGKEKEEPKK